MTELILVLQDLLTAGYVLLAILATREWSRRRVRSHFYQAGAIDLLAVVVLVSRVAGTPAAVWAIDILLLAFTGSAIMLMLLRATFVPLSRVALMSIIGSGAVLTLAAMVVWLPSKDQTPTTVQSILTLALVCFYAICLGEPAIRFLLVSRGRPAVQRARLRGLSAGYLAIVLLLIAGQALSSVFKSDGGKVASALVSLAIIPALWAAFSPPAWLRRAWRSNEVDELRRGVEVLLRFTEDRPTLAANALTWALRLVGGEAGFLVSDQGYPVAMLGIDEAGVARVTEAIGPVEGGLVASIDRDSAVVTVPIATGSGEGRLVVLSGPFTPVMGANEVDQLSAYAASVSVGLERVRLTESLAAMERAKTAFLNLASHELRGPLTVIRGYVSMMAAGDFGRFPELETLVIPALSRQAEQMTMLVDQMIETARLEDERLDLTYEICDLSSVALSVVGDREPTLPDAVTLTATVPPEPLMVSTDHLRVRTIVTNLIDNAVKYSPAGGSIECEVLRSPTGGAAVEVRDHGIGIREEDVPRLFTRFGRIVTSENAHIPGTGLGLYLCRELARRLGGDIIMRPGERGGSIFTLFLPGLSEKQDDVAEAGVEAPRPLQSSRTPQQAT